MRIKPHHVLSTLCLLFSVAVSGIAQEKPAKVEVFGGYVYLNAGAADGRVNLNGGTLSLERNLNRSLAVAADFVSTFGRAFGDTFNSHSAMFGPKFTARKERVARFAHTLVGVVREREDARVGYGFGMALGGGIDYDVNRRVSFRLVQGDYTYGRVNNRNHHNLRVAAGLVL
jgi:hypothetical protein